MWGISYEKILLLIGFLAFLSPLKVSAASNTVDDQANLLTPEERTELSNQADAINQKIKGEVFILTTDTNSEEPRKFADDQLRARIGNDHNGALLFIGYEPTRNLSLNFRESDRLHQ